MDFQTEGLKEVTISQLTKQDPLTITERDFKTQLQSFQDDLELEQDRTLRVIARARFWQTIIAGVLIVFAGYALFADSFMGTPGDIASAFFWAFVMDISIATVTSAAFTAKLVKNS
jgi:hypothetical protein